MNLLIVSIPPLPVSPFSSHSVPLSRTNFSKQEVVCWYKNPETSSTNYPVNYSISVLLFLITIISQFIALGFHLGWGPSWWGLYLFTHSTLYLKNQLNCCKLRILLFVFIFLKLVIPLNSTYPVILFQTDIFACREELF